MPILIPLGKSGVRNTAVDVAAPGGGEEEEGAGGGGGYVHPGVTYTAFAWGD